MEKPDARAKLLVPLVAVCIALQTVTLICLAVTQRNMVRRIDNAAERPVYVSGGSSFNYPWQALYGYAGQELRADPNYYQDGQVIGVVEFTLAVKIPESRVVLRYRINAEEKWRQVALQLGEPMRYSARLRLNPTDKIEYQMLQIVGNEVVQASEVIPADVVSSVGRSDVSIYLGQRSESEISIEFLNEPAVVEALQVAEIRLKINKAKPEEVVLKEYPWTCRVSSEGFDGATVTVTVTYKDGAIRTVTYNPALQDPPIIKR